MRLRYVFFSCACTAIAMLGAAWLPLSARAQTSTVLVPVEIGGSADAPFEDVSPELSTALRTALSASTGIGAVVSDGSLGAQIAERVSREEVFVGDDEVGELADAVRTLEEYVALRQREAAIRQAQRVEVLSHGTVDALSTQGALAATIFSGCLADAWLHIQLDEDDAAHARLLACRQLHPDVSVSQQVTAPPVYRLLTRIDSELAALPAHMLSISGAPAGCDVVLNGRRLATTPNAIERLPVGDYQIELRCPGMDHGRVHGLAMPAEDRSFTIDPVFDDALRSAAGVRLVYPSAADARAHVIEHALRLVALASASDAVLVWAHEGGVRADRLTLGRGVIASVIFDAAFDAPSAASALAEGRSVDLRGGRELVVAPWSPTAAELVAPPPQTEPTQPAAELPIVPIVAGAAGAAGALTLVAGWGVFGEWYRVSQARHGMYELSIQYLTLEAAREYYAPIVLEIGISGAALAALSVPFWLPPERDVPWWSWVIAAGGAALLASGIAMVAIDSPPTRGSDFATCACLHSNDTLLLGQMLIASSAPFFAVPTTHLLRLAVGPLAPQGTVDVGPEHASFVMRGQW